MSDFLQWLSSNSAPAIILIITIGLIVSVVIIIYVVSFIQGRELSFWPPKIGPKPDKGIQKGNTPATDLAPGLEGYWLEELDAFKGRPYSIGKLVYNQQINEYTFDGKNYHADGSLVCTWDSIHVHIDLKTRLISYIFKSSVKGELHSSNYGFCVLNLRENEAGELIPVDGHFIDSEVNASPQSFNLKKLDELEKNSSIKKTSDIDTYHSELIREYHLLRIKNLKRS